MRWNVAYAGVLALSAAARFAVALADPRALLNAAVYQDDVFYYLTIARNWLAGRGPSFDGETLTNAFHPLWLGILAPIVAATGDDLEAPIRSSALLLAAIGVATGALVHALVRRLAGDSAALCALGLWAVSPLFVFMGVNGLETGLALCIGLACVFVARTRLAESERPRLRDAALFGALGGLAVLARVDSAVLLAVLGADWLLRAAAARRVRAMLPAALLAAAASGLVWLPWGATSRSLTGAWLPTSGAASHEIALHYGWSNLLRTWSRETHPAPYFDPAETPAAYRADVATKGAFVLLLEQPLLAPLRVDARWGMWPRVSAYAPYRLFSTAPLLGTAALALLAIAFGALAWRRRAHGLGLVAPLHAAVLLGAYTALSPAHWYFTRYLLLPILLAMVEGLCLASASLRGLTAPRLRAAAAAAAIFLVVFQAAEFARFSAAKLRWSEAPAAGFLGAWEQLSGQIPPDARVGAFQAGVYGWFGRRDVINLDGKVNPDAQAALAQSRLDHYLVSAQIDYVLDWEWVTRALCARHIDDGSIRFRALARSEGHTPVVLYQVVRSAE